MSDLYAQWGFISPDRQPVIELIYGAVFSGLGIDLSLPRCLAGPEALLTHEL
jgi:hypothetical protein